MNKDITMHRLEDRPGIEFEATLDGVFIGYYDTRTEAEEALDAAAYRWLQQQPVVEEAVETVYNPDCDELASAYEQAGAKPMNDRWRNALEAAYNWLLESDGVAVEYAADGSISVAHIPSATEQGRTYAVNGACACQAAQHNRPCWHRAAKRLLCICHDSAARLELPKRENAFPAWACRARPDDLFKDED
jgi:hypothetical protein